MGHEGKILVRKVDKRAEPSSHPAAALNLLGGINTGDKSIDRISHPVELAITDSYLVPSLENSREVILERLRNDEIYRIGIVGVGGSGKTTLATEVSKKATELNLFNLAVFVRLSQNSDQKRIQGQIADDLGLRLVTDDSRVRARQIFERFQSEERVLIILDDIWARLDLQQVGIPSSENHKGCKLVLSLNYSSHWAGIENVSLDPKILALSKELVKKFGGSPLAASVVGRCLRGKTVDELVVSFNIMLQDPIHDHNIFRKMKSPVEHLSNYAVTLGLCGKDEVNAALNSLLQYCLLIPNDETKDYVIMHDLVREAVQLIVEEENPDHRDSIREYLEAVCYRGLHSVLEDFRWKEELDELVHQIFHVRDDSSSSIVAFSPHVYTHPEPSGKLVDFKGMCQVDESYLPFLKEVWKSLGHLLFMLNNAAVPDWVYLKDELKIYWDLALLMQFDLEWLKPVVDTVLSSTEIHRTERNGMKKLQSCNNNSSTLRQKLKSYVNNSTALRRKQHISKQKLPN
ncbi:hypothetical protein RIF29_17952 [Crotalaria pallida]|uniref:AAA+ ATPase domain-containing protein n=1 Tax=Crotalaria pallida TaxID=3830 RepID=A0AAN9IKK8_CROPI